MFNSQTVRKLSPFLALASCMVAIMPTLAMAQSLPGYMIFSGVDPANQLSYRLDSGSRNTTDRYLLKIPGSKINSLGAAQIEIVYPNYYKGTFDENKIQVLVDDKEIPIQSTKWDRERNTIKIDLVRPLRTKSEIQVVLSDVKNPENVGTFYFDCLVKSSPEFPIARKIGTWILTIE